jgi:hypothetical protein
LFVGDRTTGVIGEYTTAGATVNAALITESGGGTRGLGLDGQGHIFAANELSGKVAEYTTAGSVVNASFCSGLNEPQSVAYEALIPGDFNSSGIVDVGDYQIWFNNYGKTNATFADGDATGNGIVDVADYQVWFNNYGATSAGAGSVPEPASLSLLVLGGLALLRRKAGSNSVMGVSPMHVAGLPPRGELIHRPL